MFSKSIINGHNQLHHGKILTNTFYRTAEVAKVCRTYEPVTERAKLAAQKVKENQDRLMTKIEDQALHRKLCGLVEVKQF